MRVTQSYIAELANVSQATVSRVVAGDTRVEPSVAARIREVMAEHDYRPDERARSLRGKGTGLIGLVVSRPPAGLAEDPFFSTLVSHILDFLVGSPFHLCLDVAPTLQSQQAVYDEMLRTRRVDGLILVESEASDRRIAKLQQDAFPFVLIGHYVGSDAATSNLYSVDNDNVHGGDIATQHLIQNGYKRVGILAGRPGITFSEDRIEGYRKAIAKKQKEELVWHSEFGFESARFAAKSILSSKNRPDALVVLDDFMAMGVTLAARDLGVSIPSQLGIVSFNDSALCGHINGGLTSMSLNIPQIVQSACGILLGIISGKAPAARRVTVPCELRIRGSSLPTSTTD